MTLLFGNLTVLSSRFAIDQPYLVVVSDKLSCRDPLLYSNLKWSTSFGYYVYIVEPTENVSPESPDWPGSLLDQGDSLVRDSESEQGN